MLEVNPRASRTVPFASKAIGVNLVDAACRLAAGASLAELDLPAERPPSRLPRQGGGAAVRALPGRRPGARARDALDRRGDGERRPTSRPRSRRPSAPPAARSRPAAASSSPCATPTRSRCCRSRGALAELGFELVATAGTARALGPPGSRSSAGRQGRRRSSISSGARRRSRRQHARRAATRAATATRSARRRWSRACRASRRSPSPAPPSRRSRTRAPSRALRCRSGMRVETGASVVAVAAVEPIGAYTLAPPRRAAGSSRACRASSSCSRRPGRVLPRPFSLCIAPRGELGVPIDPIGPGTRALAALEPGDEIAVLRPARERLPARRAAAAARRRRDRDRAASRTSRRRSSGRRRCSASAASTTPRRRRSSRTPRS